MKVEREATYRKPEGEELTLADLGLLVAHLQTEGQAPMTARVYLRVDQVRVEWSTEQEGQAELDARLEAERLAREEARRPRAVASGDDTVEAVAVRG